MRLLLDQNLSPRLLDLLADLYPGSRHVRNAGLGAADDERVWSYAAREGLTIVSKDTLPSPQLPVRWAAEGGLDIAGLLRQHHTDLVAFDQHAEGMFLALG